MAVLPSDDMDVVWQELMSEFSSVWRVIPVNKNAFRSFLEGVDGIVEDAEGEIVQLAPAGPVRDWLIANQEVGRSMVIRVMEKRREVF